MTSRAPGLIGRARRRAGSASTRRCLRACLNAPLIVVLLVSVLFAGAAFACFGLIRQELTPPEDRSHGHAARHRAAGRQPRLHAQQMRRIEELIQPLRDTGEVESIFAIAGQAARSTAASWS